MENTLGGLPTWNRDGAGQYRLNLTGAFGVTRTAVMITINSDGGVGGFATYEGGKYGTSDNDNVVIFTWNDDTINAKADMKDDLLFNNLIDIKVYNI